MKKLARLIAATALALGTFAIAHSTATPAFADGACRNITEYNDWIGAETSSPNYSRTQVQAFITYGLHAYPCNNKSGTDALGGTSSWVALVPRTYLNQNAIMQVGILECGEDTFIINIPYCYPTVPATQPHFVWAFGGCNGAVPYFNDAGAAPTTRASYVLFKYYDVYRAGWYWAFNANGTTIGTVNVNSTSISCWTNGNLKAVWATERWDRGDHEGSSTENIVWDTMAYKATNSSSWQNPNLSACNFALPYQADQHCTASSNTMHHWSHAD